MSSSEQLDGAPAPSTPSSETSPEPAQQPTALVATDETPAGTSSAAADTTTARVPSSGSQRPLAIPAKSSSSLAELQEHLSVLRDGLVAAEESLDTVPPEEYRELKTAMLQVSNMISQMEAVADSLSEKRLNLRNELRTLQDENVHLQGALAHERRKSQARGRGGPVLYGGRAMPIPPPPPPPPPPPIIFHRDSVALYSPMRGPLCSPILTRYRLLNENEASVIDLTNESSTGRASSSRTATSVGTGPGSSATLRRGRGLSRNWRGGTNSIGTMTGLRRTGNNARRSRGTSNRARTRRPPRTSTSNYENNSGSNLSTTASQGLNVSHLQLNRVPLPPATPTPDEQQPTTDQDGVGQRD